MWRCAAIILLSQSRSGKASPCSLNEQAHAAGFGERMVRADEQGRRW